MFNLDKFIADSVTFRPVSMFATDIEANKNGLAEVNGFFEKLEGIFAKEDFTKAQVVEAIKAFIPNFEHEEKGKNLDQKM